MHITPAQCRAARGLVDMDQGTLADGAMVTPGVIINFLGAYFAVREARRRNDPVRRAQ